MSLESLKKKLYILKTLSRLIRIKGVLKKKQVKKFWIRDILKNREEFGAFNTLFEELKKDREHFFRYLRMTPDRFGHLLSLVQPKIEKKDTHFRKCIPAEARLALTLRFLASGETQQSLAWSFRIGRTTVSRIVSETCVAISDSLKDIYLKPPKSAEEWKAISEQFEETWNFPHVIGAIDGKHIRIQCPSLSGTLFHNYKGFFSIVLLAICDADYCFTLYDIGSYGSNNDSGVLANSVMGQLLENNRCRVPSPEKLDGCSFEPLPYYLVGDEIFPLKPWLIRPYPGKNLTEEQRIYNYRHSRCRRVIENASGILVARWRIFLTPIRATVENVEKYVLACLCLHNYLRKTKNAYYSPSGFVDSEDSSGSIQTGEWRSQVQSEMGTQSISAIRGSRPKEECIKMRDSLKDFLNTDKGSLPWQLAYIRRTYQTK